MNVYLETFLENQVPPGRAALIRHAIEQLLNMDRDDVITSIESVIAVSDDVETHDVYERIEQIVLNEYDDVLGDYGVGFTVLTLNVAPGLLQTLLTAEDVDDYESILNILDDDGSTEEKFAEIVHHVTLLDTMEVLETLEHVSPSLLDRLEKILFERKAIDEAAEEHALPEHNRPSHIKVFLKKHPTARLNVLLGESWQLGYDIEKYLDATLQEDDSDKVIAVNFMAAALASGYEPTKAHEVASRYLEVRYEDSHLLHRVISYINSFLNGDFNESS